MVGPWLLALFVFVVCGSGKFTIKINKLSFLVVNLKCVFVGKILK